MRLLTEQVQVLGFSNPKKPQALGLLGQNVKEPLPASQGSNRYPTLHCRQSRTQQRKRTGSELRGTNGTSVANGITGKPARDTWWWVVPRCQSSEETTSVSRVSSAIEPQLSSSVVATGDQVTPLL